MQSLSFKEFLDNLIIEDLHPELREIIGTKEGGYGKNKQTAISKKIKELSAKGESTGIESKMPRGSSRAYLQHKDPHKIILDGKPEEIKTGTKVAIKANLDKFHDKNESSGLALGAMQNHAEGGREDLNKKYRILSKESENNYKSNKEQGIFPPLIDHDKNHEWTQVGHARNIRKVEFKKLTKTPEYPEGLDHKDFFHSLFRFHEKQNGKYWERDDDWEKHMNHIQKHPLVKKFLQYHKETGANPSDYHEIKNLGVFEHPDGSKHIVARDHGFNTPVEYAYMRARNKRWYKEKGIV